MKKAFKITFISVITILVILQFFDPAPVNPIVDQSNALITYRAATGEVVTILKNACYDCHSYETKYAWYAYVAPVSWYIENHVSKGKEHVNFSIWTNYTPDEQEHILEECFEEIKEGEMPLKSYQLVHPEARLSEKEKDMLLNYFKKQ